VNCDSSVVFPSKTRNKVDANSVQIMSAEAFLL
jgi:hypothetical protein